MHIYYSENTCSMAEIGHLWERGDFDALETELAAKIKEAQEHERKMLIANVSAEQALKKELMAALKKYGFKKVGSYYGNSDQDVHVYIRGLKPRRKVCK